MKNIFKSALILAVLTALGATVSAQTVYPNKPIRYIVPVAAGGGSDTVGRTVTERWGKVLNQTFIVEIKLLIILA